MIIYDSRLDEVITPTKKPSRLGVVVKIANEVSKSTTLTLLNICLFAKWRIQNVGYHYRSLD